MSHSEPLSRLIVGDRRNNIIKWVLQRAIDRFERDWKHDGSYVRNIIDSSPRAAWLFSRAAALGQFRREVPIKPWCAAGSTALANNIWHRCLRLFNRGSGGCHWAVRPDGCSATIKILTFCRAFAEAHRGIVDAVADPSN